MAEDDLTREVQIHIVNATAAADDEAVEIVVEGRLKRAAEKVQARFAKNASRVHRLPAMLRGLSKDGRYVIPNIVAIGPYHHARSPQLQEAEEVKRAAAYYFCEGSGHSAEEMYRKILSVAGEVRSYYADDAVEGVRDDDLAAMMFHDGCFLLQFMLWSAGKVAAPLEGFYSSNQLGISLDILQLENQIPWLVLGALMAFRPAVVPVEGFIAGIAGTFSAVVSAHQESRRSRALALDETSPPPHLLGLLRSYLSGRVTHDQEIRIYEEVTSFLAYSSATELGEIGIKVVAGRTAELKDMGIKKGHLFGHLFLAPILMDDIRACCLLNMAALETCVADQGDASCSVVSSYIAIFAMLMNREKDVHELRTKRLVSGEFSDHETFEFFNGLVRHLCTAHSYFRILAELEVYRRKRWLWIIVHKFVYNNYTTIVKVVSIVGVLVGIFKTLISIQQQHHTAN